MLAPHATLAKHPCSPLAPPSPPSVMITASGQARAQPALACTRQGRTDAHIDWRAPSDLVGPEQCDHTVLINESLLHGHHNDIISRSREVCSRQPWTLTGWLASALTNCWLGQSWSLLPWRPVAAIRLLRLDAPDSIQVGQPMRLRCLYETRGDRLDSLSWSKNGKEFYRYQPGERRKPVMVFEMPGISPDRSKSKNNTVVLTNTTLDTTGRYKCEVTGSTLQVVNMEVFVQVKRAASSALSLAPSAWMCALVLVVSGMFQLAGRRTSRN